MARAVVMLVVLLAGCAAYAPIPPEETVIRMELPASGLTRNQLFERSEAWLVRHLSTREMNIEVSDKAAGIIVASGCMDYPAVGALEAIEKIQYTISFTMREEIRDSGVTLVFSNPYLDIPRYYHFSRYRPMAEYSGGYSVPIRTRANFDAARRGFHGIAERLRECLLRNRCD